jgi:hypothetical protein
MRASRLLVSIVTSALVLVATHPAVAESRRPRGHVRAIDSDLRYLLSLGYEQSATFRSLIDALDASDVIVYVERDHKRRRGVAGSMRFVTHAGGHRYVRITLYELELTRTATALLGHELQHAAEVASAPWVVDQETCASLYREIGHYSSCRGSEECFDTAQAVDTGYQVLRELQVNAD